MDADTTARRDAIQKLLRTTRVGTQEELREQLASRGFDVTQATLSRDLARLHARRVSLPDGGALYELAGFAAPAEEDELGRLRDLVVAVEESLALVVVMTTPGAASAIALAVDRARLPEALGSVAGDDTLFVAPVRRSTPAALAKRLRKVWKKDGRT